MMHVPALRLVLRAAVLGALLLPGVANATDLHVTVEIDQNPATVGHTVEFVFTAHNTSTFGGGPLDSGQTTLIGQVPVGFEILEIDDGGLGVCVVNGRTVTCVLPFLLRFTTFKVLVNAIPTQGGFYQAEATVKGDLEDPQLDNNAVTVPVSVYATELLLSKGAPSWVLLDQEFDFSITVANLGPEDATNVQVQDALSGVFAVQSATSTHGPCEVDGQNVFCTIGDLPAGEQATVTIRVVGATTHPGRENTAGAGADNAAGKQSTTTVAILDPDEDADGDGVSNGDEAFAGSNALEADYVDLVTQKTGPSQAFVTDEIEYQLSVTNVPDPNRPSLTVQDVEISDLLPKSVTFVSASGDYEFNPSTRLIVWNVGSLAPGQSKSETVRVRVNGPGNQEIINSGAALGAGVFEVNNLNNASTATTFVISATTDLSISKNGPDTLFAGQTATYVLTVANAGPDDASDVRVTDVLPDGLSFQANGSDAGCSAAGQTVTCEVGSLAAGAQREVTLVVSVGSDLPHNGTVINQVSVSGGDEETDPSSVNNDDDFSSSVHNPAPPCKAYVLLGDFNGAPGSGFTGRFADKAATEAVSDYQKAGYVVVRIDSARSSHMIMALNDPETKAIWFLGHGAYRKDLRVALLNKWFGTPDAGLGFHDRYLEPRFFRGATYPNIEQVTIHACSQDLPEWRAAFPTAVANGEFNAWSSPTRGPDIYLWQFGNTYPKCSNDGSSNKTIVERLQEEVPLALHQRLWQEDALSDRDSLFVLNLASITNSHGSFVLDYETAAALHDVSFNLYTYGDSLPETFVFGATIDNGRITLENQSAEELATPDFTARIRLSAMDSLRTNPDLWQEIVTSGSVDVETSVIYLDEDQFLYALGKLLYGYPYEETNLALDVSAVPKGGGSISYAFDVTNHDNIVVTDAQVVFEMPENVSMSGGTLDCAPHAELDAYVCHTGFIPPGETISGTIDVTVDGPPGTSHETLVSVIGLGYGETDPSDNSTTIVTTIEVEIEPEERELPTERFALHEAFPNPFSHETTIRFEVPNATHVLLRIHDILGREVVRLADGPHGPGTHQAVLPANDLPSGLYIVVLEAGGHREARTLTLVR